MAMKTWVWISIWMMLFLVTVNIGVISRWIDSLVKRMGK